MSFLNHTSALFAFAFLLPILDPNPTTTGKTAKKQTVLFVNENESPSAFYLQLFLRPSGRLVDLLGGEFTDDKLRGALRCPRPASKVCYVKLIITDETIPAGLIAKTLAKVKEYADPERELIVYVAVRMKKPLNPKR